MNNSRQNSDLIMMRRVPTPVAGSYSFSSSRAGAAKPEESQLLEYWRLLRRRGRFVIVLGVLGMVLGIALTLLQTPLYRARTSLDIQAPDQDVLKASDGTQTSGNEHPAETYIQTELKILQSNFMLNRVIGRLKTRRPRASSSSVAAWRSFFHLSTPSPESWDTLLDDTARRTKVRSLGLTRIVEVVCDSRDPRLAGQFCNTLAQEYIANNLETRWQTMQSMSDFLSRQLEALKRRLAKSEGELQESARESALLYAPERDTLAQEKLRQLQAELSNAQSDRVAKQSQYEMASAGPDSVPAVLDNAYLREYQVKLEDLQRQLAELSSTLTPQHYKIRQLETQITQLNATIARQRDNIIGRMREEFEAAQRREALLLTAYQAQMGVVAEQAGKGVQYNMLKREVDSTRKIYEAMLQRVEELGLASAVRASTIRVMDPATRPAAPFTPNVSMNSAVGLFAGLFLGTMFAIIQSRSERTLKEPGDTSLHLDVRELGVIPSARTTLVRALLDQGPKLWVNARTKLDRRVASNVVTESQSEPIHVNGHTSSQLALVSWHKRRSDIAESFAATMNSVLFGRFDAEPPKAILVTSPDLGAGKTTVCSNLAIALAGIHKRVLLVEGDLRRPSLHKAFEVRGEGMTEILAGMGPIEEIPVERLARQTAVPNLWLLPAGGRRFEPELLYSNRVAALFRRLRSEFDVVLVDSPPMLHVSDARVLGRLMDGVILVFRAGRTTVDLAVATHNCFYDDGTRVLGTILNDWDPRTSKTYGGNHQNYRVYFDMSERPA